MRQLNSHGKEALIKAKFGSAVHVFTFSTVFCEANKELNPKLQYTCSFPSSMNDGSHATLSRGYTCNFLLALVT